MYSATKNFLDLLGRADEDIIVFTPDETRTAIAALYYRVILVDGRVRIAELDRYRRILGDSLDVSEDELMLFEETVFKYVQTESSLYPLTNLLKKLSVDERMKILGHMQQISISDRELHEFEINMVTKTAELLGLDNILNKMKKL